VTAVADVFISHVEEDAETAHELAQALQSRGTTTWHPRPGETAAAGIGGAKAVVVLCSAAALGSARMRDEVLHACGAGRPMVPVLIGLDHDELTARQPEWRAALGAATSIEVPPEGLGAILPRLLAGIAALTAPPPRVPRRQQLSRHRRAAVVALAGLVTVVASAVVVLGGSGEDGGGDDGAAPDGGTRSTEHVIPRSTEAFSPGPLADSATTAVTTVAGRLRVSSVRLQREACSRLTGTCRTAPGDDRFVVVTVSEWDGRDIVFTDDLSRDMDRSYVLFGDRRATFALSSEDSFNGRVSITYEYLPTSALRGDVRLAWPGSATLVLHLAAG
jgi:hypothetical protein